MEFTLSNKKERPSPKDHQIIYLTTGEELHVKMTFTEGPGGRVVLKMYQGGYCYANGKPIKDRGYFDFLPESHKSEAYKWFDELYGEKQDIPIEQIATEVTKEEIPSKPKLRPGWKNPLIKKEDSDGDKAVSQV